MLLNYRPEIDGLRAIAIIPVILFHAGLARFSGGFIGVDVFFVISGYLITSGIIRDLNEGRFSLVTFYERRSRRILPALFFIMLISFVGALFILTPTHMKEFTQSMAATVMFVSNIFFYMTLGYFNTTAEFIPLLHTWSLAVEEQFYLIFPIIMMGTFFMKKHMLLYVLIALTLLSFGWANWSSFYADPTSSFYLLVSRGWEILAGSITAIALTRPEWRGFQHVPILTKQCLSSVGLCLIIISFFIFADSTPHPSYFTLTPVIGTVLVILFGSKHTLVCWILSKRLFVGIGLISYSLYLWHQPIFVFNRYHTLLPPSDNKTIILILLALLLSIFSWYFIERPFRNASRISKKQLVISLGLTALLIGAISIAGNLSGGFSKRMKYPPNIEWIHIGQKLYIEGEICEKAPVQDYPHIEQCYFGDITADTTIGLIGDSHAQAISKSLNEEFKKRKIRGSYIQYNNSCEVVFGSAGLPLAGYDKDVCAMSFVDLQRFAKHNLDAIVLLVRWAYRLYPVEGAIETPFFDNGVGGVEPRFNTQGFAAFDEHGNQSFTQADKKRVLKENVEELSAATKLLLVYPIPEIGFNIFQENTIYYKKHNKILDELIFPSTAYDARNKFVVDIFDELTDTNQNAISVRTRDVFCDHIVQNSCVAQHSGVPFYLDDDHLSDAGATLVVNKIFNQFLTNNN